MEIEALSRIVEALLFSSQQPLNIQQIAKILEVDENRTIKSIINNLNEFYRQNDRSFSVIRVAGGYQLRTKQEYKQWIQKSKIIRPISLSPTVLETLSIVAYRQPVTRAEIEEIRTVDATYSLHSLLGKKLIRIVGKKEIAGRPLLYGTSRFFLEVFGFNHINELPKPEEFDIAIKQEEIVALDNKIVAKEEENVDSKNISFAGEEENVESNNISFADEEVLGSDNIIFANEEENPS